MSNFSALRSIALAAWLGAAAFFSFVVAPAQFSVLRSFQLPNANEIAGTVVTRTLSAINISGFLLSFALLAVSLVLLRKARNAYLLSAALFAVMAAATAAGQWLIAARMKALRVAMLLPIDQVSPDDLRRLEFDQLHHYSVTALGIAMLSALIALCLTRIRTNQ